MGLFDNIGLSVVLDMTDKMSGQAKRASQSLKGIQDQSKRTSSRVIEDTDRMTAALSRYARGFTVGLKLMAGGTAMIAPIVLMGKAFTETERTFADVVATLVSSGVPLENAITRVAKLKQFTMEVASVSGTPLKEMEASIYTLVSAYGELPDPIDASMKSLKSVHELSLAGKGTMKDAADAITSAFLTFGKKDPTLAMLGDAERAEKIANMYAAAIGAFKTDLPSLMSAMQYATPAALTHGVSLAETLTAVSMAQSRGMKGTMAGTGFAAFFRGLANTADRAQQAIGGVNVNLDKFIGLAEGMDAGGGTGR